MASRFFMHIANKNKNSLYEAKGKSQKKMADFYESMLMTSEQILKHQMQTNQELQHLQQQMRQATAINQQMLQNQMREIEERETQKFYKLRSFRLNELVTKVEKMEDINQQAFIYYFFKDNVSNQINEAQANLNEISDKEYCNNIKAKLEDIESKIGDINALSIGDNINNMLNGKIEYTNLCNELNNCKESYEYAKNTPLPPKPEKKTSGIGLTFIGAIIIVLGCLLANNFTFVTILIGVMVAIVGLVLINGSEDAYKEMEKRHQDNTKSIQRRTENLKEMIESCKEKIANCKYSQAINDTLNTFQNWKSTIDSNLQLLNQ